EAALPSMLTSPATPEDACAKPDPARSSLSIVRLASKGVSMTFACRIGPALPVSLMVPPPATSASNENGKEDSGEKSFSSTLTFWRVRGFTLVPLLSENRPLVILTSFTERSVLLASAAAGAGAGEAGAAPALPPRLEKFQSPAAFWIKSI